MRSLVSIVIPVYNVIANLDRAVQSVIHQTYSNWELILIDDGSTDGSGEVCEKYEKSYPQIHVVHQRNKGVSAARNIGINVAKGEFLTFVDSDDYISSQFIERLVQEVDLYDIIIGGYHLMDEYGTERKKQIFPLNNYVIYEHRRQVLDDFRQGRFNYIWGRIFSSKIIKDNKIKFDENIKFAEDTIFMIDVLNVSKSVKFIRDADYFYVKYSKNTLSTVPLSIELFNQIDESNELVFHSLRKLLGNIHAKKAVAFHVGILYKEYLNLIFQQPEVNWTLIRFMYSQSWFKYGSSGVPVGKIRGRNAR